MNAVGWFEIPVLDMDRAIQFYQNVLNVELSRQQLGASDMAWFPWDEKLNGASGSLVKEEGGNPGKTGTLIYFACHDVADCLARVEQNNGAVEKPKTMITEEIGYFGVAHDTEGNRIAFHSRS